ncbi:MAG: replication-associated recombination protein A [Balneolaceae bacterium]|nr:MAG: replication-associated recombination protein A [Balneolaceae bacterium]
MDLFENKDKESGKVRSGDFRQPLATRMRPQSLNEFKGQSHLVGEGKLLQRMIISGVIGSMILHGPPSSGKTTLAHVISQETEAVFEVINAVLDGLKELRAVVARAEYRKKASGTGTILFIDEIHRWNRSQQDALLPHLESGILTLIGATTENPFYSLVSPLLSRCQIFELHSLSREDLSEVLDDALTDSEKGLGYLNIKLATEAKEHLAEYAGGDVRNALNALEVAALTTPRNQNGEIHISIEVAKQSIQKRNVRYDGTGDEHYHYASAFIKSMRGSDVDASLYWMMAMLEGGEDPAFIFRRMLIFASEDVGMADPYAITVVNSAHEAFLKTGMPEGFYFLAHCSIFLALCAKSNSTKALFKVQEHIIKNGVDDVPAYLRDKTASKIESEYLGRDNASEGYQYPHDFPGNWVDQRYLPEKLHNMQWYEAGSEGREAILKKRIAEIKKKKNN